MAIRGCSVEISGDGVDASPRAVHPSVRAYAANGLALKVVREYSEAGMKDGRDYTVLRFWGTVATVEVDEVKEWKTVSLPLNLKPAPALRRP